VRSELRFAPCAFDAGGLPDALPDRKACGPNLLLALLGGEGTQLPGRHFGDHGAELVLLNGTVVVDVHLCKHHPQSDLHLQCIADLNIAHV
jgi:hypothetical protein